MCVARSARNSTISAIAGLVFLLTGLPAASAADEDGRATIAVMDLREERGLDEGLVKLLNELILTEFEKTGKYRVLGRSDIQSMLKHEKTRRLMADCDDVSCLSEIGGALGVERIAVANVGKVGDAFLVNMKIINVRQASVEGRVSYKVEGDENDLMQAVSASVERLITGRSSGDPEGEVVATGIAIQETSDRYNLWGHISFWGGVGATAFGGVAMALSIVAADDYESGKLDAQARSETWARAMYAGFGVGAAMLATGIILWLLDPAYEAGTTASLAPTRGGDGAVVILGWNW